MRRAALEKLNRWKKSKDRKPLLICGPRQVGKTWLMQEFARLSYRDFVYVDFASDARMRSLFAGSLDTRRLIFGLEIHAGLRVDPQSTLLIFDGVEHLPRALSILRYFYEYAPQYHIVCAASRWGNSTWDQASFPEGKVDIFRLHPLSFKEFLIASNHQFYAALLDKQDYAMIGAFRQVYLDALGQYFLVGGMPEAVKTFAEGQDFQQVRAVHKRILSAIFQDFSEQPPELSARLHRLWSSIPQQLSQENKKFTYNRIRRGSRAAEYEAAIDWLCGSGLIHRINRVSGVPLRACQDPRAFKLFLADVGLLACMAQLPQQLLLDPDALFSALSGGLTEQYVCQQLMSVEGMGVYYYANDRGAGQVEFVTGIDRQVVPMEVCTRVNRKSKSLQTFREKYRPTMCMRVCLEEHRQENGLVQLPLYAI